MSTKPTHRLTRRQVLKRIAAASGAVAFSNLPQQWQPPLVEVGVLPAHAQGSTATFTTSLNKIYWVISAGATEKIQWANLNGSNIEDLVTGLVGPYNIALAL